MRGVGKRMRSVAGPWAGPHGFEIGEQDDEMFVESSSGLPLPLLVLDAVLGPLACGGPRRIPVLFWSVYSPYPDHLWRFACRDDSPLGCIGELKMIAFY